MTKLLKLNRQRLIAALHLRATSHCKEIKLTAHMPLLNLPSQGLKKVNIGPYTVKYRIV